MSPRDGDDDLRQGTRVSTRTVVWSATTLVCVLFVAFALTQRESAPPAPAPARPVPVYGDALPATSAFGPDAVCTEYEYFRSQGWLCLTALANSAHAPVHPAARYSGPCAHLTILDRAWICLGNDAAPPLPVPAPTTPSVNS